MSNPSSTFTPSSVDELTILSQQRMGPGHEQELGGVGSTEGDTVGRVVRVGIVGIDKIVVLANDDVRLVASDTRASVIFMLRYSFGQCVSLRAHQQVLLAQTSYRTVHILSAVHISLRHASRQSCQLGQEQETWCSEKQRSRHLLHHLLAR